MNSELAAATGAPEVERRFPPVAELAIVSLALVTVMLVIFALDVPLIIAFTVARYSSPPHSAS